MLIKSITAELATLRTKNLANLEQPAEHHVAKRSRWPWRYQPTCIFSGNCDRRWPCSVSATCLPRKRDDRPKLCSNKPKPIRSLFEWSRFRALRRAILPVPRSAPSRSKKFEFINFLIFRLFRKITCWQMLAYLAKTFAVSNRPKWDGVWGLILITQRHLAKWHPSFLYWAQRAFKSSKPKNF